MSKVKIQGNASGTGIFTVSSPNSNTDREITLPDGAGEILLSNGDGSSLTGISSVSGNTPYFRVWNSTQTAFTANSSTKVTFDGTTFNPDSAFNTSNSRFEPDVAGKYLIIYQVQSNLSGSTSRWYADIKKNGSLASRNIIYHYEYTTTRAVDIIDMNGTSDYLEFYLFLTTYGAETDNNSANTFVTGFLLSE